MLELLWLTLGLKFSFKINYLNALNSLWLQGLHRLEKYLSIQDCLEKSLKTKFALKST